MTFWSESRRLFKKVDKFATIEMLRYKDQTEYATYTGACLSVVFMALVLLIAASTILDTLQMTKINASSSVNKEAIPSNYTFDISTYKFGIQVVGVDFSDPSISYFDVVVTQQSFNSGVFSNQIYPIQACRAEDWNISEQTRQTFNLNSGSSWLCPIQNLSATVGGSNAASNSLVFKVDLYECGTYYNKTNCANSTQISQLFASFEGQIQFLVYTINTQIQADQGQPIKQFLDDTNILLVGQNIGQLSVVQLAQYSMETDTTLLPWKNIQTKQGSFLRENADIYALQVANGWYSGFVFSKAKSTYSYTRSFQKFDQLFSYLGGLIGMVMALFIVFLPYTELCYQFSLCNQMFLDSNRQPIKLSFNFLKYVFYQVYYCITYFFSCCKIEQYELYKACSDQIQRQIDVSYLFKRINSLQRLISFSNPSLNSQDFQYQKMTLDQSQVKRKQLCYPPLDTIQDPTLTLQQDVMIDTNSKRGNHLQISNSKGYQIELQPYKNDPNGPHFEKKKSKELKHSQKLEEKMEDQLHFSSDNALDLDNQAPQPLNTHSMKAEQLRLQKKVYAKERKQGNDID